MIDGTWTIVQSKKKEDKPTVRETRLQIEIYISGECYNVFLKDHNVNKFMNIKRLTSLTPIKRHITAITNLSEWLQYKSLLAPTLNDPYYQVAEQSDGTIEDHSFSHEQTKAIKIAVNMFDDIQERFFLIDGPTSISKSKTVAHVVGHLLKKLDGDKEILICAPSNTAHYELMKKILDYFNQINQTIQGKIQK
ncbi:unnamed protein product [Didymodactylos carnosus]|uniref:DNA2/NAM7 helicase helicase domain-containing protein n=1 Tax=Didymodactylos carnosus TaxID=1234261 RepID=A0A8S2NC54_9BILA|nr:unnamed protein product [Didymodactylos carnosus]CAF3996373.1 unnamed protein product [Didymodactylos carnosus]